MSITEAATYLGISKATLYTWRTRRPGFGPRAVKAGGALRYRQSDLETWIEEHAETLNAGSTTTSANADDSGRAAPDPTATPGFRRSRPRYRHPRASAER
ncbi:helix-turn-helix domain-containing protein [Nocardioides okcheonensis]|uniref:helix-turn-helix domain-containing protein n=1 Tax=Nocardioides okcheonensis TaxID=2894081 RepID=UPI0038B3CF0A